MSDETVHIAKGGELMRNLAIKYIVFVFISLIELLICSPRNLVVLTFLFYYCEVYLV
jgi:hypothetical protein